MRSKRIILIGGFFIAIALTAASFVLGVDPLLHIVLLTWLLSIVISFQSSDKHRIPAALVCFLVALFIFLLGREFEIGYLGFLNPYPWNTGCNTHAFASITLSIVCVMGGYWFVKFKRPESSRSFFPRHSRRLPKEAVQKSSRCLFWVFIAFGFLELVLKILFTMQVGYLGSYIAGADDDIPFVISFCGNLMYIPFFVYLVTAPPKKECMPVLFAYAIYGTLTLFTGHRIQFIGVLMLLIVYVSIRQRIDGGWVKKGAVLAFLVTLPIIAITMGAIDSLRVGGNVNMGMAGDMLLNFLDQQGGSINVIKNELYFEKSLNENTVYSLSGSENMLFGNKLMSMYFELPQYSGNSLEHALSGNSLAHTLSLFVYGDGYLNGHGVGSSFIAELYHDASYVGVALGSVLYGVLLRKIDNLTLNQHPIIEAFILSMATALFFSPRDSFDAFLTSSVLNPYNLIALGVVLAFAYVLNMKCVWSKSLSIDVT